MTASMLTHRLAQMDDLPALHALMNRSISELQRPFLTPQQIAASHHVMGWTVSWYRMALMSSPRLTASWPDAVAGAIALHYSAETAA